MLEYRTGMKVVSFMVIVIILGSEAECPNTVYVMITFRNKLFSEFSRNVAVTSPQICAELCRDEVGCKSFGMSVNPMTCYLYNGRIYAGSPESNITIEIYYYWKLEAECPVKLGYNITVENNTTICSKYYANESKLRNWTEAQVQCDRDGGHLLFVDSEAKKKVLDMYQISVPLEDPTFIGSTDIIRENEWLWLNGEPVNRQYFASGKPSNFQTQNCLTLTALGFNDKACSRTIGFICEVSLVP